LPSNKKNSADNIGILTSYLTVFVQDLAHLDDYQVN